MGDNRAASVLVECAKCGQRFQGIVSALTRKACPFCGGELKPVEPKAKEPR
jgi:DNA-directed RNA polymerase subunit RPC12/RpoP